MKVIVCIYFHPEAYPPTLNAIEELSTIAEKVNVIYRPHLSSTWQYAANVVLIPSGKEMSANQQEQASILIKVGLFIHFCKILWKYIHIEKPDVILLYDPIPLLAYRMVRYFTRHKALIWYHNHDVVEPNTNRKYSIGWWAAQLESKAFQWINLFSLPSKEREPYFPLVTYKGAYFFTPNLPALQFYNRFVPQPKPADELRLVYQGSINAEHGLEELLAVLPYSVAGKILKLHIIGNASDTYRKAFLKQAAVYKVQHQVIFEGYIPYSILPRYTGSNHIGIGINKPQGIIYQTGGTASNKIYEYVACGLPILYYDISHYQAHLEQYQWAFATDLTKESLLSCLTTIADRYEEIAQRAKTDFQERLNYERGFNPILVYLKAKMKERI